MNEKINEEARNWKVEFRLWFRDSEKLVPSLPIDVEEVVQTIEEDILPPIIDRATLAERKRCADIAKKHDENCFYEDFGTPDHYCFQAIATAIEKGEAV